MKIKLGLVGLTFVVFHASASNMVDNGSFEQGIDPGSFHTVKVGEKNISEWEVIAGNVDYIGTYWPASNGSRSIDMNGDKRGAIMRKSYLDTRA